ncbi:MAG: hypothetical protein WAK40_04835 [Thermoplasmata archaeon]
MGRERSGKITTVILSIAAEILQALALVPSVSVTRRFMARTGFALPVVADVRWSEDEGLRASECLSSPEPIGNATVAVTWASSNGATVGFLELTTFAGAEGQTWLVNFTHESPAGFARSSASVIDPFCGPPFYVYADAVTNLTVVVKAELFYNYTALQPVL